MAITNAQQYQQLVSKPANGKRPGYRGDAAYGSKSEQSALGAGPGPGADFGDGPKTYAPTQEELILRDDKREEKLEKFRDLGSTKRQFEAFAQKFSPIAKFASKYGPLNTRDFYVDKVLGSKNFKDITKEDFANLPEDKKEELFDKYQTARLDNKIDAYGNEINNTEGSGGQQLLPPVLAQAPRTTEQEEELSELGQLLANMSGQRYAFMADGGRIGLKGGGADYMKSDADKEFEAFKKMYMQDSMKRGEKEIKDIYEREKKKLLEKRYGVAVANGGIMSPNLVGGMMDGGIDEMGRQMYGLGKLVKKATRAVKKIAKSPIGKAALAYGLTFGIPGVQSGFFSKGLMGTQKGLGFKKFLGDTLFGKMKYAGPVEKGFGVKTGGLFNSPLALISGASALAGLMTKQDEEDDQINLEEVRGPRLDIAGIRTKPYEAMGQAYGFYAEGGDVKEPVAKKTLPLLDMDGKEKDYRETGGFVDIGRMEKADDVPARLSKNEFVFTADAVRNAGDGDIDKGAEVMYNMMKNLEAGGDVSEESQGLEGARKMFQTSQRLEEVL